MEAKMKETQESIAQWAAETFGEVGSNARVAARANEEMAELLRALSADDNNPKAAEEVADVMIVLYRLASRMGVDLDAETSRTNYNYATVSNFHAATYVNSEVASLLQKLAADDGGGEPKGHARYSLIRVACLSANLGNRMGFDLDSEVNRKMAINRKREWKLDGTGHGYHVRDKTVTA